MTPASAELVAHSLAVARDGLAPGAERLGALCLLVQRQAVEQLNAQERWDWLAAGLDSPHAALFLDTLRLSTALKRLLPEVAALFGVPQLSDAATPVDIGAHQWRVQAEAARQNAPLAVRFAALVHEIGKGTTPPEIWPSHHKHESRGLAMLAAIGQRLALPAEVADLAALVIADADRVHRASDHRAGPMAAQLTHWQALERPERFEQLLQVCTCDWAAYEGHDAASYPKAPLMRRAVAACATVPPGLSGEALVEARALAVARALGSLRWSA